RIGGGSCRHGRRVRIGDRRFRSWINQLYEKRAFQFIGQSQGPFWCGGGDKFTAGRLEGASCADPLEFERIAITVSLDTTFTLLPIAGLRWVRDPRRVWRV